MELEEETRDVSDPSPSSSKERSSRPKRPLQSSSIETFEMTAGPSPTSSTPWLVLALSIILVTITSYTEAAPICIRLHNVQDWEHAPTQLELIRTFRDLDVPITLGVVSNHTGVSDPYFVTRLNEIISNQEHEVEVGFAGLNHETFAGMSLQAQIDLLEKGPLFSNPFPLPCQSTHSHITSPHAQRSQVERSSWTSSRTTVMSPLSRFPSTSTMPTPFRRSRPPTSVTPSLPRPFLVYLLCLILDRRLRLLHPLHTVQGLLRGRGIPDAIRSH